MQLFIFWGSIVTTFSLFDMLPKRIRFSLAYYMYGLPLTSFPTSFKALIEGFLSVFSNNGKLSFLKIYMYSTIFTQIICLMIILNISLEVFSVDQNGIPINITTAITHGFSYYGRLLSTAFTLNSETSIFYAFFSFIVFSILTATMDYWNFYITKKLLIKLKNQRIIIVFIIDLIISLLPVMLFMLFFGFNKSLFILAYPEEPIYWIHNLLFISAISVTLLFFIQICSIFFGSIIRASIKISDIATQNDNALLHKPFTIIGVIVATFYIVFLL
jgi:hypothetical protein